MIRVFNRFGNQIGWYHAGEVPTDLTRYIPAYFDLRGGNLWSRCQGTGQNAEFLIDLANDLPHTDPLYRGLEVKTVPLPARQVATETIPAQAGGI